MKRYEAVIVGGGPAGLAGALYLARFRRRVVVVDEGDSRAARIPRTHNVAGFPNGVVGTELIGLMRRQAEAVGVDFVAARVDALEVDGDGFTARWAGGAETGRTLLLATGASDIEPNMPHLAEALKEGALRYCPVCDGFEVVDCDVGVLCNSSAGLQEAVYLHHFTPRVQVFVTSRDVEWTSDQRREFTERGITLHADPVDDMRLREGKVVVRHGAHQTVCDSLYSALGMDVHSRLAAAHAAERDAQGYLVTDRHQQTTIAGLYSAGDVALGLNQISVGIGAAAVAASAMHLRLSGRAP